MTTPKRGGYGDAIAERAARIIGEHLARNEHDPVTIARAVLDAVYPAPIIWTPELDDRLRGLVKHRFLGVIDAAKVLGYGKEAVRTRIKTLKEMGTW